MKKSSRTFSWFASLVIVVGLHIGLFLWAMYWQPQATPIELPPAAMIVELEPLPPAPPKPAPPPPPEVVPEEPEPQPKLVEAPKPTLAVTPPKPKPKPKPKPPKPKPPEPKPPEPQDEPPEDAPPAPPAPAEAKPAAPQQAPVSAPSKAQATWQSQLLTHLAKYKRYPEDARRRGLEGVNRLRFVVDANGMVLSYTLVGKSSSASLDRATLQMIRRAQPLPKPPADMLKDGSVEIVAPFIYSLERGRGR
ncbi:energy transducer TonB [Pseudomonas seleniipraecipitans]|jgi:periplasmic protein TonB|uniref:Energy transducer TonB n=1 Tax=Phytopseudomonas seleniipraecipitans TaxID=640205 RepID=A0A1G7M974_9GAMM|nr:energy transducer TonB [Pseudomonas seleniipraecipitans]NQD80503.1 energy transducer TonB [Pseudomonas sp. CrR14]UUD62555.1 energy transducer TonB [Pseudomonas seleniipraecipitans]SDF58285.1 outer membrane transport energization protein TonB [Pseudomonas seleniipraecipitans]